MDTNGGDSELRYTGGQNTAPAPVANSQPAPQPSPAPQSSLLQWKASEFIDHEKNGAWIILLALAAFGAAVIVYFMTKNIFSSVVLLLAGVAFGVFAFQKPRTLTYSLMPTSIKVGEKTYSYDDFRTFSIMREGAFYSVFLEPMKRFMPPLTIYFAPEDGEKIFDTLAQHIPHQEKAPDALDRFMQRIRF